MAELMPLIGFGAFGFIFLMIMLFGLIEVLGKFYATVRVLVREDLIGEQRVIYLLLIWFIPIGWAIYFMLGNKKTAELFRDVDFL